jgi:thiol-disulfide isomerase/thioredoxin
VNLWSNTGWKRRNRVTQNSILTQGYRGERTCLRELGRSLSVVLLVAGLAFVGCSGVLAELPAGWKTDYTNALADAKTQQQPLLIYFTASWCGPCRTMAHTTLTNQAVLQTLSRFTYLALDIDDHPDLAERHGIRAVPTFQIFTPFAQEVASITGYQEAGQFFAWLTNSAAEVKAILERQRRIEQRLAVAQGLLLEASPESQRKAVNELFDLCAEQNGLPDETIKSCLDDLAKRSPALLLDGLNHPRLVVRIRAVNLLRARLGDSFDFDPWVDAGSRQKAVAQWREKLASADTEGR